MAEGVTGVYGGGWVTKTVVVAGVIFEAEGEHALAEGFRAGNENR